MTGVTGKLGTDGISLPPSPGTPLLSHSPHPCRAEVGPGKGGHSHPRLPFGERAVSSGFSVLPFLAGEPQDTGSRGVRARQRVLGAQCCLRRREQEGGVVCTGLLCGPGVLAVRPLGARGVGGWPAPSAQVSAGSGLCRAPRAEPQPRPSVRPGPSAGSDCPLRTCQGFRTHSFASGGWGCYMPWPGSLHV